MIDFLLKLFGTGLGQKVGNAVSDGISLAALSPAAIWLTNHKAETFVCFSYGELATVGAVLFVVVKVAHYTTPMGKE